MQGVGVLVDIAVYTHTHKQEWELEARASAVKSIYQVLLASSEKGWRFTMSDSFILQEPQVWTEEFVKRLNVHHRPNLKVVLSRVPAPLEAALLKTLECPLALQQSLMDANASLGLSPPGMSPPPMATQRRKPAQDK